MTLAALRRAIAAGSVGRDDEVVLVITGNGLKTLEVLDDGDGLPEPIAPTYEAFESLVGVPAGLRDRVADCHLGPRGPCRLPPWGPTFVSPVDAYRRAPDAPMGLAGKVGHAEACAMAIVTSSD